MNPGSFQYCNLPWGFITQGNFTKHLWNATGCKKENFCKRDAKEEIKHVKNLFLRKSEGGGGSAIGVYFNKYVDM